MAEPTGIISRITEMSDKVLLAPLDAPEEINATDAIIVDHPGGDVVYDLTYAYDQESDKFIRQ